MSDKWKKAFGKLRTSEENNASDELWNKLEQELEGKTKKRKSPWFPLRYAAAIALVGFTVWIGFNQWPTSEKEVAMQPVLSDDETAPVANNERTKLKPELGNATTTDEDYTREQKKQLENTENDLAINDPIIHPNYDSAKETPKLSTPSPIKRVPTPSYRDNIIIEPKAEDYNVRNVMQKKDAATIRAEKKEVENTGELSNEKASAMPIKRTTNDIALKAQDMDFDDDSLAEVVMIESTESELLENLKVEKTSVVFFEGDLRYKIRNSRDGKTELVNSNTNYPRKIVIDNGTIEFIDKPNNDVSKKLEKIIRKEKETFLRIINDLQESE